MDEKKQVLVIETIVPPEFFSLTETTAKIRGRCK